MRPNQKLWFGLILVLGIQPVPVRAQSLEQQILELREKLKDMDAVKQKLDDLEAAAEG